MERSLSTDSDRLRLFASQRIPDSTIPGGRHRPSTAVHETFRDATRELGREQPSHRCRKYGARNAGHIPDRILRQLGIDGGDRLRWRLEDGESVRVEVIPQRVGTFSEFGGHDGTETTDVSAEHDAWDDGVE